MPKGKQTWSNVLATYGIEHLFWCYENKSRLIVFKILWAWSILAVPAHDADSWEHLCPRGLVGSLFSAYRSLTRAWLAKSPACDALCPSQSSEQILLSACSARTWCWWFYSFCPRRVLHCCWCWGIDWKRVRCLWQRITYGGQDGVVVGICLCLVVTVLAD